MAGRFGKRGMGNAKWAWVPAKLGKPTEQFSIRRAPKQGRQKRIFLRSCFIDRVDIVDRGRTVAVKIHGQFSE
jgi:hypothetical protein